MFEGGIRPHFYCLPVAKRERHRLGIAPQPRPRATRMFFLGTDSAPRTRSRPRRTAQAAPASSMRPRSRVALPAEVFDEEGALDKLEGFLALLNGPAFYRLPGERGAGYAETRC